MAENALQQALGANGVWTLEQKHACAMLGRAQINPVRQSWRLELWTLDDPADETAWQAFLTEQYDFLQELTICLRPPQGTAEFCQAQGLVLDALAEACPEDGAALTLARVESVAGEARLIFREGQILKGEAALQAAFAELCRRCGVAQCRLIVPQPPAPLPTGAPPTTGGGDSRAPFRRAKASDDPDVIYGRTPSGATVKMGELSEESGRVVVEGTVFTTEEKELKGGKTLYTFALTDYTGSVSCKIFADGKVLPVLQEHVQDGQWMRVGGECQYDTFSRDLVLRVSGIRLIDAPPERMDTSTEKRIELHLHTQMSTMDGLTPIKDVIQRAARWGHEAIAITDHGIVQAFPDAAEVARKAGIKVLLGVEAYMLSDRISAVSGGNSLGFDQPFVIFDLETTGLDCRSDEILEIGAVRMVSGEVVERFGTFVAPTGSIPAHITHLTGITDDMVEGAPGPEQALADFAAFAGDDILVAHNASFDMGFIRSIGAQYGLAFANGVVDTLALSRALYPHVRHHRLNDIAKRLNIRLENHHRAVDDATCTGYILTKFLQMVEEAGVHRLCDINGGLVKNNSDSAASYHTIILVKNQVGLKNLYKLVSRSHLEFFNKRPRMPKAMIEELREGLIIGSACEAGELYRAMLGGADEETLEEIAAFYDYLEIQPLGNNAFLVREGRVRDEEELQDYNRRILALGDKLGKPVVATGDVHFLEPRDEVYRRILMHGQKFEDADLQAPLYFRTTQEMLDEFAYLGPQDAHRVVIDCPKKVADWIEPVEPLPPYKLYAPHIEGAQDTVVNMSYENAKAMYGDPLPEIVQARLDKELGAITKYGFSVLYLIAHKLVQKSLSDDYLVGSRGSVGSSLVATMCGITEVNALSPHYLCKKCKYSDFDVDPHLYDCGPDLPDKVCPVCGEPLSKQGFDIPFEVFLGFEGDKVPDIDLNFSGEYQPRAHKYTEELLGPKNVFRAGTIGTIAEKTAYGYVKNYLEEKGIPHTAAEIDRLVQGCTGIKRTTGQHPGGLVVVPDTMEIYDFCPVQHPADDVNSDTITTHFDFNSLHDRLVKLDILGHDDPTMLRMLKDITGIEPRDIPLDDPETMAIFSRFHTLGLTAEQVGEKATGATGIPEFGTKFVRQMLEDTRPTTFSELVRISGLSHGTDVWLGNAQDLILSHTATLRECICCRDDIMLSLMQYGVPPKMSFTIMESVRKGKGLKPEMEEAMAEHEVPEWFCDSCRKIKYMFPKGHAVAYVTMAFRIAWFKVHIPEAYYATYFTVRADDFDASLMLGGEKAVREQIAKLEAIEGKLPVKEKGILTILEVILEMHMRGIQFTSLDLYESDATRFKLTPNGLRPPFNVLPGLGDAAAQGIVDARNEGRFLSIEDLQKRAHISKSIVELLREYHCLDHMSETNQLSLFDAL